MDGVNVETGMMLLYRNEIQFGPETVVRYELMCVTAVRKMAKGAKVTLLSHSPGCSVKSTATFPDGLVADPFRVFALSHRDLAYVWSKLRVNEADRTPEPLAATPKDLSGVVLEGREHDKQQEQDSGGLASKPRSGSGQL